MLRDTSRAPLDVAASAPRPQRTGASSIERAAVARVRAAVASMPASLVVQLALWPDELARWARAERADESLVYNMLAGRKPYARTRERLAQRLGVPTGVLAQLIEGVAAPLDEDARAAPREPAAGELAWRHRRGGNPIELAAVRAVEREVAAMPAASVVGLVLWPETLSEWARREGLHASAVWAALAGTPSDLVTRRLAQRLDVAWRELMALIDAERLPARGAPAGWSPSADAAATHTASARPVGPGMAPEGERDPAEPPAPGRPIAPVAPAAPVAPVAPVATPRRARARPGAGADLQLGLELG